MVIKALSAGNKGCSRNGAGTDRCTQSQEMDKTGLWSLEGFEGEDPVKCQKSGGFQQETDLCW